MTFTTYCTYILQLVYTYIRHQSTDIVTSADTSQRSQDRFVFVSKPSHASTVCSITGIYVKRQWPLCNRPPVCHKTGHFYPNVPETIRFVSGSVVMSHRHAILYNKAGCNVPATVRYVSKSAVISQWHSVMSQGGPFCHKTGHFCHKTGLFDTRTADRFLNVKTERYVIRLIIVNRTKRMSPKNTHPLKRRAVW